MKSEDCKAPQHGKGTRFTAGLLIVLGCCSGVLAYLCIELTMTGNRGADFNQFHAAAILAGTGRLYDFASLSLLERAHHEHLVPFGRLPFYAVLFKPIALLPYESGRFVWMAFNLAALAGFAITWPLKPRNSFVALFWSCPVWMLLNYGQDTALFLFFASLGLRLLFTRHDLTAGLVLSLCAAKFHLALAIPLFLAANRRWGALVGGTAGCLLILALSSAAEGPHWVSQLVSLSHRPDFNAAVWRLPNLAGLVHRLPAPLLAEIIFSAGALLAVWRVSQHAPLHIGMMTALAAGLLVSHHAQAYDCVLLLPALFAVLALPSPLVMRVWALVLLIPLPYLFLLNEQYSEFARPVIVGFPMVLLMLLVFTDRGHVWNSARDDDERAGA
jgi:hypothetical protein